MFKLLIVFLFILKIKSENENNIRIKMLSKRRALDVQSTEKAFISKSAKERLSLANPMTKSKLRDSIGQRRELNRNGVASDQKSKDLSFSHRHSKGLVKSLATKPPGQEHRENIKHSNALMNKNLQQQEEIQSYTIPKFTDAMSAHKSTLLRLRGTTKSSKNVNFNRKGRPGSLKQGQKGNIKSDTKNLLDSANEINEVPPHFLENTIYEGNDEEQSKNDRDSFAISKYKSDTLTDTRNQCFPIDNKATSKNGTPMILFDSEQDDGPLSLIFSLINLNTLRPKTRLYFTENRLVKKGTTQDRCKCAPKMSRPTKKPTTEDHNCPDDKKGSTSSTSKIKMCATVKTSTRSTPWKVCQHITPLFTVQPWPDLTLTRNLDLSSKFSSKKIQLAHKFFSSHETSRPTQQSTHSLPYIAEKSTQNDARIETTFRAVQLPNNLSSFGNIDLQAYTAPNVQSEFSAGKGSSYSNQGSATISAMPNTQYDTILSTKMSSPLPLIAPQTEAGVNTSATQEPTARPVTNFEQIKLSVTSSILLTRLVSLSLGDSTNTTFKIPTIYPTQESIVANPLTSFNQMNVTVTSSAPDTQPIKQYQVIPTNTETNLNIPQSTSFLPIPKKAQQKTENNEPSTTRFPEISPSNSFSKSVTTSFPLQESILSNRPGIEPTICLNLSQPLNGAGSTKGFESQVAESTSSLFPLCPGKQISPTEAESSKNLKEQASSDDSPIMNFSPPPAVVYSHEPEFIVTLFNDEKKGQGHGQCADLIMKTKTSTDNIGQFRQIPSHLEDLFDSFRVTTAAPSNEPVQRDVQSQGPNDKVSPTGANQPVVLGYLKSVTSGSIGAISRGPVNAYFSESKENVGKCLADFSRIFENLATKKCE